MTYRIYTDGSTRGNGKENAVGGWAFVVVNEDDQVIYSKWGAEVGTTNQRMELTAAYEGLELATLIAAGGRIQLYTDSAYLHNCYTQGWYKNWQANGWKTAGKKEVKNIDLWQELLIEMEKHEIIFHWVKGHDGNEYNEICDKLAVSAYQKFL